MNTVAHQHFQHAYRNLLYRWCWNAPDAHPLWDQLDSYYAAAEALK